MTLLNVTNLCGGYGAVDILNGVDLNVKDKEIITVAGANGSGKSTLARALAGLLPRTTGSIEFDGHAITSTAAEKRVYMGIGYVPQVNNVFPNLTIEENLTVVEGSRHTRTSNEALFERFPALAARKKQFAESLSGGERQQLAIARALVLQPRMIIMDEPSAALSPALADLVFALIQDLAASGVAVLLVEQRAREALAISDRGYIMGLGKIVAQGTAANLLADEDLARLFLGH